MTGIVEIILFLVVVIILLSFVYAGLIGAPWVPTKKKDISRFIKIADIERGQVMYDIGCGDGRLVMAAARVGADARGLEISLLPYGLAKLRALIYGRSLKAKIFYKDLWKTDISDADVVYVWLMPAAMPKLKQKFEAELKPGAKVVAYIWPMDGWSPVKTSKQKDSADIFLYEM